jgi:hypothetical protein
MYQPLRPCVEAEKFAQHRQQAHHARVNQRWPGRNTTAQPGMGQLTSIYIPHAQRLAVFTVLDLYRARSGPERLEMPEDAGVHSPLQMAIIRQRKPAAGLVVHLTGERSTPARNIKGYESCMA